MTTVPEATFDIAVIGAGMAGASIASALASTHRVLLIEQEDQPGYHATGRSAAVFTAIYGGETVRALSRASRGFLTAPPDGFADEALSSPLGNMFVARADQLGRLQAFHERPDIGRLTTWLDAAATRSLCPLLAEPYVAASVYEPGALAIDVDALLQGYLRTFRRNGGVLATQSELMGLDHSGGGWTLRTATGVFASAFVVNAAGAWAGRVAAMAGSRAGYVQPFRRTAILVDPPADTTTKHWPIVMDIDDEFYFKPDAGALLLSPADETACEPCDAQPDEWDIAVAVDRVCAATTLEVRRVRHSWAGLRTFTRDRLPIAGPDRDLPGFYWLAGQGGYGIQTAPALAHLLAARIRDEDCPEALRAEGVCYADTGLERFDLQPAA
ncbi:NAD(P)/FAD-dependent oxidoreductase [Sphingosinicella microcystinivorans]|uniref:D-arginine dehydrogenase n=1 Tax=Sphingosinicella microcystinivorans TaxID=335406 RepID=A0AAD1D4Z3_SPHMI|nr:FAD-dependent oxidoreductase [Sphingosinicella microcystinivorans]RKS90988.1 D-arginine dehydrogenase [Sphingosinicella microcystinivorans]BBE33908.1 glycerol-3-phosphate dehydrogenase [Sphingosinicella microcystinivorans]